MTDIFRPGSLEILVLLSLRVGGMMLIAPLFSARPVPMMLRTGLIVLVSVLLHPIALEASSGVRLTPEAAIAETLVGLAIGMGVALIIAGAEMMGDLIAVQTGLSGAASLDPLTNQSSPVVGHFAGLFATTVLLTLDAHLVMLGTLGDTLSLAPVGAPLALREGAWEMVMLAATLFALGVRFAAPVIVAVLLGNVALAILARVAPKLNMLALAFPLQIAVGVLLLGASLPMIAAQLAGWTELYGSGLDRVFGALLAGAAP